MTGRRVRVLVVGLGDAPRDPCDKQQLARRGPRRVTELHREARHTGTWRRQVAHERLDQLLSVLQGRRALEEDAAEPVAERLGDLQELAHVVIGVLEPLEVRDPLIGLQGEHEPGRACSRHVVSDFSVGNRRNV